ncbi:chromosome segregation protein SMC [Candidatus Methylopumilus turicensis]|uniref:Chromosome partition protein Smc n=1 Tax=Candidatus Methylopumilus turicensis TaxID=1581680 RepID=A0A0B7IUI7_9PROT|nr:chromosome segregation protein SMC [Candidatus Methylopumilus turicensis]CEN55934.1 Chromosome partition protein Smc [Candidatus Methylopumilus turicensis]
MRLTHLKLAGFKSFVDPTTLHIHGQRVGVVGPNGCGKSNVMESVRWVLGESSAKELRGDSMDAVIFNGSGNRKAISRASVELVFDNSLGDASGSWSQYAEIAVKRVIERDKGSTYYINNTAVRRRDVADLFLGTGLGGRAYAIIGQNTISRIVEAKPEELRVFLEEAAGISKYKERRRETELRLRDTRENLTRVEDIRLEMDKQITRLESQAVVTEQYHRLQQALKHAQGQLWLLRKRDASASWEKTQRAVEKLVNDLESQMAALRKTESLLESLRQQHYASTEAVQVAQTQYYETNAEVSNLETQVKHTQEARDRLNLQLEQTVEQALKSDKHRVDLEAHLAQLSREAATAEAQVAESTEALNRCQAAFPEAERAHASSQKAHAEAQRGLSEAEQSIRLESTNIEHLSRSILDTSQRLDRLMLEQGSLALPNEEELTVKQAQLSEWQAASEKLNSELVKLKSQEQSQAESIKSMREQQLAQERTLAQIDAQIASLSKIQQSLGHEAKLDAWLSSHQLSGAARIWQQVDIKKGWEVALEAVLGSRLNALINQTAGKLTPDIRPPSALVIAEATGSASTASTSKHAWKAMRDIVDVRDNRIAGLVEDWLDGVYLLEEGTSADLERKKLSARECLVNAQGDVYSRHSLSIYAAQSAMHGVLERQRELDELNNKQPEYQVQLASGLEALASQEQALQQTRQSHAEQQQAISKLTQNQHALQIELQGLNQQRQHVIDRRNAIQVDLVQLQQCLVTLNDEQNTKQNAVILARASLSDLQARREQTFNARQRAELSLNECRNQLQTAEKSLQEKVFNKKLILNSINELNNKINLISEEKIALANKKKEAEALLDAAKMEGLRANLEAAINLKQTREVALAAARDAMASAENELQTNERNRMQNEQVLHPLRDKLEQARLQEQQARLHFEQCQAELVSVGIDEATLAHELSASAKIADFETRVDSLSLEIEGLGAVNLAAIQELNNERERKTYLDSQAADLEEAINTLEDAIRRIDKETRTRLQHTFDEANRHFGELFQDLFGGGQARLELLGDEILDTGMQVFAQPPGKKNSTIHLLSGGEKALTALALVFALFKLNPAPFCLMDEVDAPLDDSNTDRFCAMVKKMSERTQFLFVSHNKITMEMAQQLVGVTMQESGVSRVVEVDMEAAMQMNHELFL